MWDRKPPFGLRGSTVLTVDNANNVYLAGVLRDSTAGLFSSNAYPYNCLIMRYDTTGNEIWAKVFGDTISMYTGSTYITATVTDIFSNTIVAGISSADSVCFGSITLYQTGHSGTNYFFYAKYDSSGNLLWAKYANGDLESTYHSISRMTTDAAGNFYMVGNAGDSISFGTAKTVNAQSFLGKFNISGDIVWMMHSADSANGIITNDAAGNIYVSDLFYNYYFSGTDSISFSRTPSYFGSALSVLKFDTSGYLIWARQGPNAQSGAMACSSSGSLYLGGNYNLSSITFGDTTLANGAPGSSRVFLAKLDTAYTDATNNVANLHNSNTIYPNPTTGMFTLIYDKHGYTQVIIYDVLGRVIYALPLTGTETKVSMDMGNIPDGSYYLKATGATATETLPFVVRR